MVEEATKFVATMRRALNVEKKNGEPKCMQPQQAGNQQTLGQLNQPEDVNVAPISSLKTHHGQNQNAIPRRRKSDINH
jgi:hypothetical protein